MNTDENGTPDRFKPLPELQSRLNEQFLKLLVKSYFFLKINQKKHQKTSKIHRKPSGNHFYHMNTDENATPDRFKPLPELQSYLNDEFLMFLWKILNFLKIQKIILMLLKYVKYPEFKFWRGPGLPSPKFDIVFEVLFF